MLVTIYFVIVALAVFAVFVIALAINHKNTTDAKNNQERIYSMFKNKLDDSEKSEIRFVFLDDNMTANSSTPDNQKKFLALNNNKQKLFLVDYNTNKISVIDFTEVHNYEIYENGSNVSTGGAMGGFWTGIFGAETSVSCKELKLIIRLNNFDNPQICYEIITKTTLNIGVNKTSPVYKKCMDSLHEVCSLLEIIVSHNNQSKQ